MSEDDGTFFDFSFTSSCMVCSDLAEDAFPLHFSLSVLETSATDCAACAILLYGIQRSGRADPDDKRNGKIRVHRTDWDLIVSSGGPQDQSDLVHIGAISGDPCPWQTIPTVSLLPATINPRTVIECEIRRPYFVEHQLQQWISECDKTHTSCHSNITDPSMLPTRVLEIQAPQQIRLFSPSTDSPPHAPYVCLSHCWGGVVPLRLTKETLNTFHTTGVPWDALPLTFKHALKIAWLLKIRYVWIDSLCIIQDEVDDWKREAANMAAIYSGSYLTLAATSAANSSVGFFEEEPVSYEVTEEVNTFAHPDQDKQDHRISFRVVNDKAFNSPLLDRAWIMQESLLPRRIVHFASNRLYWVCRNTMEGELETNNFALDTYFSNPLDLQSHNLNGTPSHDEIKSRWAGVVGQYSSCQLTFAKDMLPALQGIAKTFHQERKCGYYAGLWEENVCKELLWTARKRQTLLEPEHEQYIAPSWSWMSRPMGSQIGSNAYSYREFTPKASVISIETIAAAGNDTFGELVAGTLVMNGMCFSTNVQELLTEVHKWYFGNWNNVCIWNLDSEHLLPESGELEIIDIASSSTEFFGRRNERLPRRRHDLLGLDACTVRRWVRSVQEGWVASL